MSARRTKGSRVRVEVVPAQHGGLVSPTDSFPVVVAGARPTVEMVTNPEGQVCSRPPDAVTETIPVVDASTETPVEQAPDPTPEAVVAPRPSRRRIAPPLELDEATPMFDGVVATHPNLFGVESELADRLLTEPFVDWGLDESAPPSLTELIEVLIERVGSAGVPDESIWNARPVAVEGGDHDRGDRSVGAAERADGAGGALVAGDGESDQAGQE